LAVAPEARRKGLARSLVRKFEEEAHARKAAEAFLEVAETNHAARGLYATGGWTEVGLRPGYYTSPDGTTDALVLRKSLWTVQT
ncbi:MAG: GNAT family N-acetyltransferase, partial [Pseudomonadota bacterium]